ncbi:MAG: response regulator [Sporichthyaceae bacterium]|nr:response regulator [Sporichthyaceae bacterium]
MKTDQLLAAETHTAAPVLIVDDDLVAVALIEACLDRMNLRNPRVVANDGRKAVTHLERCLDGQELVPALALLDGQLPGRSGLEVLQWMRQQPVLKDVAVVMLTGDSAVDSIRDAYAGGAASYLVKPVGFKALADVLRGLNAPWMLV